MLGLFTGLMLFASCESGKSPSQTLPSEIDRGLTLPSGNDVSTRPQTQSSIELPLGTSAHPVAREWREALGTDEVYALDAQRYATYQALIAQCMHQRGFDYAQVTYLDNSRLFYRAMNPLNEPVARKYGYHGPALPSAEVPPQVRPPGFAEALNGTDAKPEFGCATPAFLSAEKIARPVFSKIQATFDALLSAVSGYDASSGGIRLTGLWSQCMKDRGYDFASPGAARDEYAGKESIAPDELRVRLADLECDQTVGLTVDRSCWERVQFESWKSKNSAAWIATLDDVAKAQRDLLRIRPTS